MNFPLMDDLYKKIKAARTHRCLKQVETAERALLSLKTYQRIESGEKDPTETEVSRIAAAFGCTAGELRNFDLESNQFPSMAKPQEAEKLLAENNRLRNLVNRLLDLVYVKRGGVVRTYNRNSLNACL